MNRKDYRPVRGTASEYKGVLRSRVGRWEANFHINKDKCIRLGTYDTEEQAALAYDAAALTFRGKDAFLNCRDRQSKILPVIDGDIARVPLPSGKHLIIDAEDVDSVSPFYWYGKNWIVGTRPGVHISLHHLLLGTTPPKHEVIHINGDHLDFRRLNLAVVNRALRIARNRKSRKPSTSIYKGVRRTISNRWETRIAGTYIGSFETQEQAALAYDEAARRRYGIFASLNFPRPGEVSCLYDTPALPAAA